MRELRSAVVVWCICVAAIGCNAAADVAAPDPNGAHVRRAELAAQADDRACGPPLQPHRSGAGVACPTAAGACRPSEHCCIPRRGGAAPACVPDGTPCPAAISKDWDCNEPADCAAGEVCCAAANVAVGACRATVSRFRGTYCRTSCAAGEVTVCAADGDCQGGVCVSGTACGQPIGVCR